VNLCELEKRFNDGETVDDLSLFDKGLIKGKKKGEFFTAASPVKILGNGELSKKLIFKIGAAPARCAISGPAKEKIQKAGGELVAVASVAAGNSAADSSAANT
jgi:large subunit ribosomal protein L15